MTGVPPDDESERERDVMARRVARARSELARAASARHLAEDAPFRTEARRQSLVASGAGDDEAAAFALALVDAEEEAP